MCDEANNYVLNEGTCQEEVGLPVYQIALIAVGCAVVVVVIIVYLGNYLLMLVIAKCGQPVKTADPNPHLSDKALNTME